MKRVPILIAGAGPAGLSLGHELSKRSLDYLILDKAPEVGSTFYNMTDSTEYGPWINNILPGSAQPWSQLLSRTTRCDYARYLSQYRHNHQLKVQTGVKVEAVTPLEGGGFRVQTDQGEFECGHFVNATGYFSNPFIPDFPGLQETEIPTLHSSAYISPKTVAEMTGKLNAKILIVGCRLSAGEIMEELYKVGVRPHISHRSKIKYWPSHTEEALISPFTMTWEQIAMRIKAPRPANLKPRLRRGFQKGLLDQGKVPTHPNIKEFHAREVEFVDGTREEFDLILFATGYLPALKHLRDLFGEEPPEVKNLECTSLPNFFFMGLGDGRNFRSQFLRGIRDDAIYLGQVISDRYQEAPRFQKKPEPELSVESVDAPAPKP